MKVRKGVSTSIIVIVFVVIIIIVGAGAYYVVTSTGTKTSVESSMSSATSAVTSATSVTTSNAVSTSGSQGTTGTNNLDPANVLSCAVKEGSVTVYGLVDTGDWNAHVASAWTADYPNIKLSYLGTDSGTLLSKITAEHKAGAVHSDVVESVEADILTANQAGAIQAWQNPMEAQMGYPAGTFDPQNVWHPYNLYITTPAYNTKLISPSDLPKNWTQLLTSPAFAGKFAFSNPTELATGAGIVAALGQNMSHTQFVNFLKQIKAQNDILTSDDGGALQQAINGAIPIGNGGTNDILAANQLNATIAPLWLNPVFVQNTPIAISQGAPDPCSAKLFIEWATSTHGQLALGASGRSPAFASLSSQLSTVLLPIPSNLTLYNVDQGQFLTNTTGLSALYSQIFG